ncbi:MAG TPA: sugar ABC transporter ATP-binding protein [Candidatus Brocadiia bacterium]|nr:sugar ABC transporter ATP-binding protein [Candidatus Brocadiia bacterium]
MSEESKATGGSAPLIEGRNLSKRFPGVVALEGVNFTLGRGEILCVIGENGAGKSTLMKIIGGIYQPDSGSLFLDGRETRIGGVQDAMALGIGLIHQELNLADNLSVAGNVFLGREPRRLGPLGIIDRGKMEGEAEVLCRRVGLECAPDEIVSSLPIAQQQLVEIAKALSLNARVLMMDEPTSSLSAKETEMLFSVIRDLRADGVGIIYISHRLGEVKEIADRVMVMRDGKNAGELKAEEIQRDRMVQLMVGRDLSQMYRRADAGRAGEVVFQVRGFRTKANPDHDVSFDIRAGEILGMAGLVGSGRTELARAMFGIDEPLQGNMAVDGKTIPAGDCLAAIRAGLFLLPEDRKTQGLIIEATVKENIALAGLRNWHRAWIVDRRMEREVAERMRSMLNIRTPSIAQAVNLLSGGNQQKTALAKWLCLEPRVLLLDEPTRGVDVGARAEIYHLMEDLARRGMAVLMISSEMEEILGMSDRVLVMHEGRVAGELSREQLSEEAVMSLATGGGM